MSSTQTESVISQIEFQLTLCSKALLDSKAEDLVSASSALQSLMVDFSKLLKQTAAEAKGDPALRLRIQRIAALMTSYRTNLIRQAVVVDRTLAALVPATQVQTYAPPTGAYGRQPYGSAGRQSGEFRTSMA